MAENNMNDLRDKWLRNEVKFRFVRPRLSEPGDVFIYWILDWRKKIKELFNV